MEIAEAIKLGIVPPHTRQEKDILIEHLKAEVRRLTEENARLKDTHNEREEADDIAIAKERLSSENLVDWDVAKENIELKSLLREVRDNIALVLDTKSASFGEARFLNALLPKLNSALKHGGEK